MKKFKGALAVIGLILIIGAAGSEQIGVVGFGQAIAQCLIGIPMLMMGVL